MNPNKYRLINSCKYICANPLNFDTEDSFLDAAAAELDNGADIFELNVTTCTPKKIIQYGKKLRELCSIYNTMFFLNSRADIGHILNADGLRLEPDDIDVHPARHLLGEHSIIGCSVYNDEDIKTALEKKADFIVVLSEDLNKNTQFQLVSFLPENTGNKRYIRFIK